MSTLVHLFLHFLLFPCSWRSTAQTCNTETCASSSVPILFPFWLEGVQPPNCGNPGLNLSCNSLGKTVLKLPYSTEFFVSRIDYESNKIELYDPEDCLPRNLRQLDLSGSPFSVSYPMNYTFLKCRMNITTLLPVSCLSNKIPYSFVMATSSTPTEYILSGMCDVMFTLVAPTPCLTKNNFQLSWSPDSSECKSKDSSCNTGEEIRDDDTNTGYSKKGLVVGMIFMSMGLLIIFTIILRLVASYSDRENGGINHNNVQQDTNSATVTNGLDESTIASFTTMVLGESRCLMGPNDNTCPICLSEYQPEEIIRCIPECKHCFHAKCIDEWLKQNITCPVCRNCPLL